MSPPAKVMNPILARYLTALEKNPLRTKATTTAVLCFLQEVLASNFAGVPTKKPSKDVPSLLHGLARAHIDMKAVKMAIYGFLISAPLGHFLVGSLQKAFAGKKGTAAKVGQILASNLLIAPIQATAYLASMAVINGAKSFDEVVNTVRGGFFSVIRISWVVSPLSMTIAQNFLPVELWVPFFNIIQFVLGTYFNTRVKQLKLAANQKERKESNSDREG